MAAVAAALRAGGSAGEASSGGGRGTEDAEEGQGPAASDQLSQGTAGSLAHLTAARRAELVRRGGEAARQLAALTREFGNRQRLVSRRCRCFALVWQWCRRPAAVLAESA